MIDGVKAASFWNKIVAMLFALYSVMSAIQLNGIAFVWICLTMAHLRVLELEHKLRLLVVEK